MVKPTALSDHILLLQQKRNLNKLLLGTLIIIMFLFTGCMREEQPMPDFHENEMITTLRLKFINKADATDVVVVNWRDLDGEGGNPPEIDRLVLKANSAYTCTIDAILNESATKSEDITPGIKADGHNHLFIYKTANLNLHLTITDKDKNDLPLGLQADALTASPGTGSLRVILRHQAGVKNGTETPGSTDIDTTFPAVIE